MIRTDVVLTLRDLRGEHEPELRRIPWGTRWPEHHILYAQALIELAGVALDWRKDDRLPAPEGQEPLRSEGALYLVKSIAKVIADDERVSLYGDDCSLIVSWEPID